MSTLKRVGWIGLVAALLIGAGGERARAAADNDICNICGMYIERFKRTAVYIEWVDGKEIAYCGVACAIRDINEQGGMTRVKSAQITSWPTQERVDMSRASYVIGSRLIPDMLPNIIAFESQGAAEKFAGEQGGKVESLNSLLVSTSYRGLTAPFRIPAAAVPPQGVFNAGIGVGMKRMDGLRQGAGEISSSDALKTRKAVPDKMRGYTLNAALGYALTDDLFCSGAIPYIEKRLTVLKANGDRVHLRRNGIGDIPFFARYRIWHDTYFDQHVGVIGGVVFPTGEFDNSIRDKPALQIGAEAFGFSSGLLYSHHLGDFWFHAAGVYTWNLENSDDYRFGDTFNYGVAAHYLPNSSDLLGIELDVENSAKNRDNGNRVANTGRTSVNCNLVYQTKILFCGGGNLSLSALIGLPVYEDVNDVQLGEEFHASLGLQWQRRF